MRIATGVAHAYRSRRAEAAVVVTLDHSASADAAGVPRPGRRWLPVRWLLTTLLVAAAVALAVAGAYRWAWKVAVDRSREAGEQRLELYVNALRAELERVEYLPGVFADDPEVVRTLQRPADLVLREAVNRRLEEANTRSGAAFINVLDRSGEVIASSSWRARVSFVGTRLDYRPYFRDALAGNDGRFYGIGTNSAEAGYYFARPVRVRAPARGVAPDAVIGVCAVKIRMDKLETVWGLRDEHVLVSDGDGVILLSSVPGWRFRTLAPLSPGVIARIRATRQYEGVPLTPIQLVTETLLSSSARIVLATADRDVPARLMLLTERRMAEPAWQVAVLWDLAPARSAARGAAVTAAFACGLLLMVWLYMRLRDQALVQRAAAADALRAAHDALERKVDERTAALLRANEQLRHEVSERERTERVLRETQDDLVQAGKMAALGQMATGITHELNQPLAALRTLSDNAQVLLARAQLAEVQNNLALISQLGERMGHMTSELKRFGRKAPGRLGAIAVRDALANALLVMAHRVRAEGAQIVEDLPPALASVLGDLNRLEQVLVNLLANALDAVRGQTVRRIEIGAEEREDSVVLTIADSGPGIDAEALPRLFEPFFTTKGAVSGLGLGLAISANIVREFGGTLIAANRPCGGALFTIELHVVGEVLHA